MFRIIFFEFPLIGADTVKRGISPITLTSSLSSSRLRDSNSSFSISTSNNLDGVAESYARGKNSNVTSSKNVLFATEAEKSPSTFSTNEQLLANFIHLNSVVPTSTSTSTSTLIKKTLSPLVHQRNSQQNASNLSNESTNTENQLKMKYSTGSSTLDNYHASSNSFVIGNNDDDSRGNCLISTMIDTLNTPIKNPLSPSRSLSNHTNTLPSQVVRSNNIQHQFESNYLLKSKSKNNASPGNTFFNVLSSIPTSNASVTLSSQTSTNTAISASTSVAISNISFSSNNIYGTLPKTTNSNSSSTVYGNVSAVANEFEQLIARNACSNNLSNTSTNNHTNYHTLGSYRIQYSSTNPFLNNFNSNSSE